MKNQKGQALVEFILILPILLLFLPAIFDVGTLMSERYQLASDLDLMIDLQKQNKEEEMKQYATKRGLTLTTKQTSNLKTFTLEKNIHLRTPGLNQVLNQKLKVEETIYEK